MRVPHPPARTPPEPPAAAGAPGRHHRPQALKLRGEQYELIWPRRAEFVRMVGTAPGGRRSLPAVLQATPLSSAPSSMLHEATRPTHGSGTPGRLRGLQVVADRASRDPGGRSCVGTVLTTSVDRTLSRSLMALRPISEPMTLRLLLHLPAAARRCTAALLQRTCSSETGCTAPPPRATTWPLLGLLPPLSAPT
jgi:hypothetical protein